VLIGECGVCLAEIVSHSARNESKGPILHSDCASPSAPTCSTETPEAVVDPKPRRLPSAKAWPTLACG
jgi:hypothetical protein